MPKVECSVSTVQCSVQYLTVVPPLLGTVGLGRVAGEARHGWVAGPPGPCRRRRVRGRVAPRPCRRRIRRVPWPVRRVAGLGRVSVAGGRRVGRDGRGVLGFTVHGRLLTERHDANLERNTIIRFFIK